MRTESGVAGRRSFIEEARRRQIVEAATRVVAEVGYGRASLARIAERAGTSKSVISYHFDGKDELLEQVARQYLDGAGAAMEERLADAGTPIERIRAWVGAQMQYLTADRTGFLAMVEIVTNHRRPDGTRPFDGMDEEETEILGRLLSEGRALGEVRDLDADATAVIIQQSMEGLLSRWAYNDAFDVTAHIPALVDFIDHAIRRDPG
ncbi:TetR/AcrR family transcriptional regulator [Actinocorallia sp. A-T 12471]|uniref:TetR/AcrR family transcriptional regulator n=1 Tax=Actinocorallia sp. A-T 12471 TaxID=3089813 RepID=UPI0029CBE0B5|nr:TetR/AcrR family transcriptional regulator [Actinocorallia sp. A-T 12471]MDX6740765.1 TetR/AcrR family transcriptional regulator [Actinocorallia sp. A-T 12471]